MEAETTTQDNCRRIVDAHVYRDVSNLVYELAQDPKYMDELSEVQVQFNDEEYPAEALEHWLVSDWLGNRLKEEGEMVVNFMNLTIWGRTTSGQAICIDRVIEDIYNKHYA